MSTLCKIFALCFAVLMTTGCNGHDPCANSENILSLLGQMNAEEKITLTDMLCKKDEPKEIRQLFAAFLFKGKEDSRNAIQWASYAVDEKPSYITYMYLYYYMLNSGDASQEFGGIEDKAASYGVKQAIFNKIQKSDLKFMRPGGKEEASPYISWMLLGTLDYSNIDTEQSTSVLYKICKKSMVGGDIIGKNEEKMTSMFPEMLGVVARSPEFRSAMPSAGENAKSMIKYKINTDDFKRYY